MISPRMGWLRYWDRWLERRIPKARTKRLGHRDIFVFPSARGGIFVALIALLLITGINYENAMILATGFLFSALFVMHIVQSYRNLADLEIQFRGASPVFAGEHLAMEFTVNANGSSRSGLELGWLPSAYIRLDVPEDSARALSISYPTHQRGRCRPGRVLLTTSWPFGWVRAWSWLDLMSEAWVYPRRLDMDFRGAVVDSGPENQALSAYASLNAGGDEFVGLRAYRPGEPMSRIAWKKLAQSGGRWVRDFSDTNRSPDWVDFEAYAGVELEMRLSMMCGHLCSLHEQGIPFGLSMPGVRMEPALGEAHLHQCLLALARFGGGT